MRALDDEEAAVLTRPIRAALVASCAVLALSACREDERAAQSAVGYGVAPSALAYDLALAPDADALPMTRPAPVGRLVSYDDGYAWAERAYAIDRAFYDVPPDYGFAYDEVQPWAWESEDDWTLYAEPISDGYRYYYYEPGADYPYFVRDNEYGYGYDDAGRLVTLYTVAGVLLPVTYLDNRAEWAGRYWNRAHDLRRAAAREQRARIDRDLWLARQPIFTRSRETWMEAAVRRDDWRSYRVRNAQRDVRRFEPERLRREASVQRLNREELRRAESGWWRARDDERRQVALTAPQRDERRWEWGGRKDEERRGFGEARPDDRGDRDRAEREARRQQMAQLDNERRGQRELRQREARQQQARAEGERREMQARQERRPAQMERARNDQRERQEAERRGRQQMQAQQEQRRQQIAQAETERRGRQEAQKRDRQVRGQQARAEGERRGRETAQAQQQQRQQAENERRGREQLAQRQHAQNDRRGREQSQAHQQQARQQVQQARQEARNAGQAARDAGGRERSDRGQGRGHRDD